MKFTIESQYTTISAKPKVKEAITHVKEAYTEKDLLRMLADKYGDGYEDYDFYDCIRFTGEVFNTYAWDDENISFCCKAVIMNCIEVLDMTFFFHLSLADYSLTFPDDSILFRVTRYKLEH